jgi:hypothetical protein
VKFIHSFELELDIPARGLLLVAALSCRALAQPSTVAVNIVDGASGRGIASADVIEQRSGLRVRTDGDGRIRIAWPADGILSLRVRQVGYVPATREFRRDSDASSLTIALARVQYVLPPLRTMATSACSAPADSVSARLSATVLEQITLAAQRYEAFRRQYPFRAKIKRRTATVGPDGKVTRFVESQGEVRSDSWGDRYRPGHVIQSSGVGFSIPLLFLETLAEPEFWRNHCFAATGVESHPGARLLRLDFEPARNVRTPDWQGSAFIDSATSELVRVDFRLVGLGSETRVRRLEGYTTFKSPSPFFVMPDSTVAGWWKRPSRNGEWGLPDVAQSLHTASIE